jgi:hypothetical protein
MKTALLWRVRGQTAEWWIALIATPCAAAIRHTPHITLVLFCNISVHIAHFLES